MRAAVLVLVLILVLFIYEPTSKNMPLKDTLDTYPWVKFAKNNKGSREYEYYQKIIFLYEENPELGENVAKNPWVQDYLLENEKKALDILLEISKIDSLLALKISETLWFKDRISEKDVEFLEKLSILALKNPKVADRVSEAKWFLLYITEESSEALEILERMPPELSEEVVGSSWFKEKMGEEEIQSLKEFEKLYKMDSGITLEILSCFNLNLLSHLKNLNNLYEKNENLVKVFFQYHGVNERTLENISKISKLEHGVENLILIKDLETMAYLADIYSVDYELGEYCYSNYLDKKVTLRYVSKLSQYKEIDYKTLKKISEFLEENPEFVYSDKWEVYRYDLLTEVSKEFLLEEMREYKRLIYVFLKIYSKRFYDWQDPVQGKVQGWSRDKTLSDFERMGGLRLLNYFVEKNERGLLAVDLRFSNDYYLSNLLNIPYEYIVNYDGTIYQEKGEEIGTDYVYNTVFNIYTLDSRYKILVYELENSKMYEFSTPLTDFIEREGEERDKIYLLINAKNWQKNIDREKEACVFQTYSTLLDLIAFGIAPTKMFYKGEKVDHLYPAYIASEKVLKEIEKNQNWYGNPFVYKGFISPYDKGGYKNYLEGVKRVMIFDNDFGYVVLWERLNYFPSIVVFLILVILLYKFSRRKHEVNENQK